MTAWTDHIREYAKKHGLTYACALSQPDCAATYKAKKEVPAKAVIGKAVRVSKKKMAEAAKAEPKPAKAVIGKAVRVSKKKMEAATKAPIRL